MIQALRIRNEAGAGDMDVEAEEHMAERVELHFLAALVDELMKALHAHHVMTREQLQAIEDAVSERLGTAPRAW